ncbi:hypothetical protein CQA66_06320 [Helicobacter aurati]|uniref:Uncharacterized protein n=1 Tax=Helicobacter aurati TaxID=137778 RepID=A0A3D8J2T6_9HELI|nr:tRNA (adenosine(37)-N6)-threonylcarbamoyltransferase complex ATPase subunit type 1 TsaE [Helicobacter aurati]RDU71570.1 hypothetical protein CQA66_06320 [Helicobacter aurati]
MQELSTITTDECNLVAVIDSLLNYQKMGIHIFLLEGEIGAGKTFLVAHYAQTLGIQCVNSPSFSFIQEYSLDSNQNYPQKPLKTNNKESYHQDLLLHVKQIPCIYHYDLYLKEYSAIQYEFLESLSKEGIHFIEWGNKEIATQLASLGFPNMLVTITTDNNNATRTYKFFSTI